LEKTKKPRLRQVENRGRKKRGILPGCKRNERLPGPSGGGGFFEKKKKKKKKKKIQPKRKGGGECMERIWALQGQILGKEKDTGREIWKDHNPCVLKGGGAPLDGFSIQTNPKGPFGGKEGDKIGGEGVKIVKHPEKRLGEVVNLGQKT